MNWKLLVASEKSSEKAAMFSEKAINTTIYIKISAGAFFLHNPKD